LLASESLIIPDNHYIHPPIFYLWLPLRWILPLKLREKDHVAVARFGISLMTSAGLRAQMRANLVAIFALAAGATTKQRKLQHGKSLVAVSDFLAIAFEFRLHKEHQIVRWQRQSKSKMRQHREDVSELAQAQSNSIHKCEAAAVVPIRSVGQQQPLAPIQPMGPPPVPVHRQGPEVSVLPKKPTPFPAQFRSLPLVPGYQAAHSRYEEIRNYFATTAYAPGSSAEVVSVTARLMVTIEGRKKGSPISVCAGHLFYVHLY
jgi:hypothetical protein